MRALPLRLRATLAAALLALAATTATAETVWRMPTEYPASAMPGENIADFADRIAAGSGGALRIEPSYDAAAGIKSAELIGAIETGRTEAGDGFGGAMSGIDPVFALSSLPFVAPSFSEARRLASLARPAYEEALAARGLRLLYVTPWPPTGIWSKTPLGGPDDLKGLAIRTYDATSTAVLARAGARAESISFADAEAKLRAGEVNAVLSSGDGGAGRKLWELLPHFTEVNYAIPLSLAAVGADRYAALSPELRRLVDESARETEARGWAALETRLARNYATMRENGVTIRVPAEPPLVAALAEAAGEAIVSWRHGAGSERAAILDAFGRGERPVR